MSITRGMTKALVATGILLGAVLVGCGSGTTNNDQGTSFLALGYYDDSTGTVGRSGIQALLGPDSAVITSDGGFQADGNAVGVFIGLQNRLSAQFIRLERIECAYEVPGANPGFRIPNDSHNTAAIISASPSADDRDENQNPIPLGTDGENSGSRLFYGFPIVSSDIISFLNVSRNSLPELPFSLIATCQAVGVTQAGDVLITNPVQFQVDFLDQAECCTGSSGEISGDEGGFQGGPGNGGGILFDDGATSETAGSSTAAGSTVLAGETAGGDLATQ